MRYTSLGFARLGEPDDLGAPLPRGFAREAMNNTVLRKPLSRAAAAAAVSSDDEATASTVMESQMEGPGVAVGPLLGAIGVQARRVHCWFWSFLVPHARVRRVASSYPFLAGVKRQLCPVRASALASFLRASALAPPPRRAASLSQVAFFGVAALGISALLAPFGGGGVGELFWGPSTAAAGDASSGGALAAVGGAAAISLQLALGGALAYAEVRGSQRRGASGSCL